MYSIGSVTPVKNVAAAVEMNIAVYFFFLSGSTLRYMARLIPISVPVAPIICPTLKRAGVTVAIR